MQPRRRESLSSFESIKLLGFLTPMRMPSNKGTKNSACRRLLGKADTTDGKSGTLFHAEYCAMPHLNLTMTSDGPQIQLWVAVSEPRRKALLAANQPVPPPCVLRALIDTGATCTALDMNAIQRLQIPVMGQTSLHTPSTGSAPHLCNQYDVALAILDSRARPMYSSSVVAVIESDLTGQGIEALVGRDVLAEGLLLYNGGAGVFTLSF